MVGRRTAVALVALAIAAGGCRVDVVTEAAFDAAGGGELVVTVRVDGATLRRLDGLGIDPALDVAAALDPDAGWRLTRELDADGGLVLGHRRGFSDAAGLTALLAELSAGLAADDPGLRIDLDVATGRGGAVELAGTAGLTPPGTTGLLRDGVPVGPAGETLAALTARSVRPVLRVRVPGDVIAHDGDRVDGRVVEWDLPVGGTRAVTLSSRPASAWRRAPWAPLAGALAAAGLGGWVVRRRRLGRGASDADGAAERAGGLSPAG